MYRTPLRGGLELNRGEGELRPRLAGGGRITFFVMFALGVWTGPAGKHQAHGDTHHTYIYIYIYILFIFSAPWFVPRGLRAYEHYIQGVTNRYNYIVIYSR